MSPAVEGEYHLYVMDMAGNVSSPSTAVVTVDDTPPTNQNTVLVSSKSVNSSLPVSIVSSGDAGNTVWLAPFGTGSFAVGTNMTSAGGTATSITAPYDEGVYYLYIVDAAGNISAASTANVTVDNTAPTNQDAVLTASAVVGTGMPVAITSSGDAGNSVWLAPSGTTNFVAGPTMTKASGLASSINAPSTAGIFRLFVIDAAGNISAESLYAVTVDDTAPTVVLSDNHSDAIVRDADTVIITATFTDDDQIDETSGAPTIQVGGLINSVMTKQTNLVWTYSWNVPAGNDGVQAVSIYATDRAGNIVTTATGKTSYTIDNTAPTNQDSVLAVSVSVKSSVAVAITSSGDAGNNVWLAPSGTVNFFLATNMTTAGGTATSITAPGIEGAYYLYVIDAAGNVSSPSNAHVAVDNTAPTNQDAVLTVSQITYGGGPVSINSSGDAGNSVWLAPSGTNNFIAGPTMAMVGGLATSINAPANAGPYRLFVIDAAGNVSAQSTAVVTVDTTAPTVVLSDDHPDAIVRDADTVIITATFTDNDQIDETSGAPTIQIGGLINSVMTKQTNLVWTYSWNVPAGNDGVQDVSIYATDRAGNNVTATTGKTSYTIDNTVPTNQNSVLTASVVAMGNASVTISSSGDAGNSVWLAPSGTSVFATSSTITTAGGTATTISAPADEGVYYLYIIDAAGNVSAPSTANVTVDNTPPTAVFVSPPSGSTYETYYRDLVIGGTDVVSYQIQLDSGNWSAEIPVANATTAINLSYGAHTLSVIGKDAAGNWQSTATTNSWSVSSYYVNQFGSIGTGNGQFTSPCGIAKDSANNIYVVDSGNNRVQKFSSTGTYIGQFGSVGTGNGLFSTPYGIVIDSTNTIFILDTGNNRVQKFNSSFTYISQFTVSSTQTAMAIAIDSSDYMYVTDAGANTITKYDNVGNQVMQFGVAGSGDGELSNPRGIAISGTNILVADGSNQRIQEFDASGNFVRKWGSSGPAFGQFYLPTGVAVRSNGNVVVTDFTSNNAQVVQEFDSSGNFIRAIGIQGTGNGELRTPSGVMEGPNSYIFVVDTQNNRVQYFNDGP